MDLLLVVSPVNARFKYMPFYYLYLAGHLEKFGYKVGIADPHFKKHKDNVFLFRFGCVGLLGVGHSDCPVIVLSIMTIYEGQVKCDLGLNK